MHAAKKQQSIVGDVAEQYRHKIIWHHLEGYSNQRYVTYVPDDVQAGAPMMVCVHGISRNVESHIYGFAPWAKRNGIVLVAPLFDDRYVAKYQSLATNLFDRRADMILNMIVAEAGKLTGAATERLHLFGYSGGAQFVHRYTMLHPHRVASFVAASAGWYTFPSQMVDYPRGIRTSQQLPGLLFVPFDFLQVPGLVLVGDRDTMRGTALKYSRKLVAQQGEHRLERGRRWVAAMNDAAKAHGLDAPYRFEELPDCGHSFEQAMIRADLGTRVIKALFPC